MVYFVELTALPVYCKPLSEKESSTVQKTKSSCCRKKARTCEKPTQSKECNTAGNCISNCPLCYVTTLSDVSLPSGSNNPIKRAYPSYTSSYLFIYYPSSWKPPNGI